MSKTSPRHSTAMPIVPMKTAFKSEHGNERRFHVMAKPGGAKCNIDCQYCFYLHKENLLHQPKQPKMDDETLEAFVKSYIESQDGEQIVFSWQGGEPTLLGLDYFRKVVELQKKYKPSGIRIENDLQTNGILLNDEWCEFLLANNFLVGLSIDGPEELHDKYRKTRSGKPTFHLVMKAVEKLQRHGVRFNALVTVNRHNVKYPVEIYRFLTRELGVTYIQLAPVVEANDFHTTAPQFWNEQMIPVMGSELAKPGHPMSVVTDWSVDPDDWGKFLSEMFVEWVNNDLGRVLVNLFETAVAQVMGKPAQLCITSEFCGKGLAIEHNGDVYSCDHYVYPEYKLSNIHEHSLNEMAFSTRQFSFGMAKRDSLPDYCKKCPYLKYCWGECPKNRLIKTPDGEEGLNYLCSGIRRFFDDTLPMLVGLSQILQQQNSK
ncbi:anaerobic sulfatase maturase [Vibrio natriegens]|uniref:Anaerobic sulfatase maturase n=1 Tax=Vibrio natriegens NBRC 15636 = ATCC 14048 = DSM 759 TaxID=1219067 RepID=A0AAN0Y5G9_VIBNA|nr:anaerobic sulfatase maturase [Vibrio natriegens]ALR18176.1 sulfatase maturase [Vibrio natriegens NBRC 15636 = ATCC 14048 = DSM 759]ANQ14124.1 anaerobic sulfatase maturase [Vibrio natriegens NBRC 15636 = ATCC 14048 = DSM 759]EPM40156.1 anaerobic sulfatase maturase [Vibrio natriegens NBRC 15636 = ATCC 14048 = DSM 759]MDX6028941.1 anaerobic sulfatase maturase [Vibrio natriegens NBRC 15636 = ATCC 14048 = DSM 759]UUI14347.1 anaerobic sulfatase maturase [Vibrio natriegens]